MVFLATPHRGADLASTLKHVLQASFVLGSKPFVVDLQPNSFAISNMNDEFRHYANSLSIQSFFESARMAIPGIGEVFVVPKDSAEMSYNGDHCMPLQGNHRQICKFESVNDPDFRILRDSLSKMASDAIRKGA